jgi:hypothetical protein
MDEKQHRDELAAARAEAFEEGRAEAREELRAELAAAHEALRASYRQGIAETGTCGAWAEGVEIAGVQVVCGREAGHPLGPYDRHKAVYGEPHVAVVWNEPEGE